MFRKILGPKRDEVFGPFLDIEKWGLHKEIRKAYFYGFTVKFGLAQ
jgi:hypothetical protein